MRRILLLSLILVLGGCANSYQQFYQPSPGPTPETIARLRTSPAPANPLVEHVPSFDLSEQEGYEKLGYGMIGYSFFNSGQRQSESNAIEQGRTVGADLVVIVNPRYTGTETASVAITTPTTSTSYSSGTAMAYGPYGTVNAFGSGVTSTYGTQTNYMPIVIHREDYGAVYLVKRHFVLGTIMRDLNDGERKSLQTNKGVVVSVVVNNTPAFNADILTGDIITELDGQIVTDSHEFSSFVGSHAGRMVTLSILRGTQRLEKSIQLLK